MNTSSAKERRALILRQLEQKEEIFVTELSRETGISEVTIRKDLTILYEGCPDFDGKKYKSSYSGTGYNVRKFLVPKSISPEYNTNPQNFVVYRFADVLLMKAEALNELGQTAQAAAPLNEVRYRAGLSGVSGLSQDEMREKIIHERRIELAFEGHRWFDMIRIDNGNYAINFDRDGCQRSDDSEPWLLKQFIIHNS